MTRIPIYFVCAVSLAQAAVQTGECSKIDMPALAHRVSEAAGTKEDYRFPLFISERPDLDRAVIEFQSVLKAQEDLPLHVTVVRVFEFSKNGLEVENGALVKAVASFDGSPPLRVGYNCEDGTLYLLYGFGDPSASFNALMRSLNVKVDSPSLALYVHAVLTELTMPNGAADVVRNKLDILQLALRHYRGRDSLEDFAASWSRWPSDVKRQIVAPSASRSGDGFEVTAFLGGRDGIEHQSVLVKPDSEIQVKRSTMVFRWPVPGEKPRSK